MAAKAAMVADLGALGTNTSLLLDDFVLDKADETTTHATGGGAFTTWLANNEKSAMYALARLPALHIVFWVVTLCVLGPRYFPSQTESILTLYFGYALPRFCVILVSGSLACYWCVRRNAATPTTSFVDRVPATAEVQFAVREFTPSSPTLFTRCYGVLVNAVLRSRMSGCDTHHRSLHLYRAYREGSGDARHTRQPDGSLETDVHMHSHGSARPEWPTNS